MITSIVSAICRGLRKSGLGSVILALLFVAPLGASAQVSGAASSGQYELLTRIGVEAGDSLYEFGRVAEVGVSGDEIFVLDAQAAHVRVYGMDGRYRRTFGKRGSGPGEFTLPVAMSLVGEEVWISDGPQNKLVRFDLDGSHVATSVYPSAAQSMSSVYPLRHGLLLASKMGVRVVPGPLLDAFEARGVERERLVAAYRQQTASSLLLLRSDAETADTIFTFDHGFILYTTERGAGLLQRYWGEGGTWAASGDSIVAFVNAFTGDVQIHRAVEGGLTLIKRGSVPIDPVRLGESDWRRVEAHLRETGEQKLPPKPELSGPTMKAQLAGAVFSSDGVLWVRSIDFNPGGLPSVKSESYLLIPFDDRAQERRVIPEGLRLKAVHEGMLFGVASTPQGADVVEIWKPVG